MWLLSSIRSAGKQVDGELIERVELSFGELIERMESIVWIGEAQANYWKFQFGFPVRVFALAAVSSRSDPSSIELHRAASN